MQEETSPLVCDNARRFPRAQRLARNEHEHPHTTRLLMQHRCLLTTYIYHAAPLLHDDAAFVRQPCVLKTDN